MRHSKTAISFFILVAVLGSQAGLIQDTVKEDRPFNPTIIHQGFQDSSDCCFSYASQIPCSRFIYYFPTSGGCTKPGIIFVTRKRKRVCANPSDQRVQTCISTLKLGPRSGNSAIA
ncbi:C-C motif chemokine 6 precursor [Rattus norvegicus]|uniref:C-C motif chemokine 6 n=3 Tax=Rattus norvegicus TaxID=10116 RepID=CCL6_RAT|nr:C-C motif chemokine 6 precursor [Rattus norvegicus]Q68FP3.1 RecName: Full=C-C motif chemokine 6; AltName: Full=Small-inducible cytokine A6; Flags: Precursor [Rattus norvegicus]AAH79460.1 Chemokine (C-C motif) ligand 6 [Rattus norvegicus]ABL63431.1 chemokine ligand 6 [Rattus norvegicus]ABL63432.1 chemokine ligand 6 [Rattus norvegicus]|eukprot:NP_001004202.1 C-C motif chemokine 6 precursor [Rattus norvegicus]